jgi:hypothetical protein
MNMKDASLREIKLVAIPILVASILVVVEVVAVHAVIPTGHSYEIVVASNIPEIEIALAIRVVVINIAVFPYVGEYHIRSVTGIVMSCVTIDISLCQSLARQCVL